MDLSANPLAVLTFLSTPAVLTNASCVLLFGTGNRYGRAIDRMHELADSLRSTAEIDEGERKLRLNQLQAGEIRASLIVRALTCFYTAVACFTGSTLFCLIGIVLRSAGSEAPFAVLLSLALAAGCAGILSILVGAAMLVRESWFSFRILRQERAFLDRTLQIS